MQKPTSIAAHGLDETEIITALNLNTMFQPSFRARGIMAVVSRGSIRALWRRTVPINVIGAIGTVQRRLAQVNKIGAQ